VAAHHLTVLHSPDFPQTYSGQLIDSLIRSAEIAQPRLGVCWYDDGCEVCSQPGVVHQLGTDYEFCLDHFRKVMRPLLLVLMLSVGASAQTRFWDAPRTTEVGIYASAIALDGWATQRGFSMPGFVEENPLARPFVRRGIGGQFGASALGFAAGVGPSYLLYRSGHRKISRIWLHVFTAGEGFNSVQMAWLVTHRKVTRD